MVHQKTLDKTNGKHRTAEPVRTIRRNMAGFAHDVVTLMELQGRLALLDAREAGRRAVFSVAAVVVAGCLLLASLTVGLVALGYLLQQELDLSAAAAFAIAAAIALATTVGLLVFGGYQLRRTWAVFERSRRELSQNLNWMKRTLKQGVHSSKEL
jgi:hypothetical protein